jgi:hypothetical protein
VGRAARLIQWAQDDSFWRANILSMPKFRAKYDQLRLQAEQERASRKPSQSDKFHATLQMGRDLQAQLDAQALAGSTLREIA